MNDDVAPGAERTVENMELVGGRPILDLVNTMSGRAGQPYDRLRTYEDLLTWCVRTELFGPSEAARLRALAAADPAGADAALARVRELREAAFGIFSALIAGGEPDDRDVALLNRTLGEGMARRGLVRAADGYCWQWEEVPAALDWMRWPLAHSAATLLTSSELDRVKECAQDDCRWIFFDESKNRSRRWCVMDDCGNRAKARRHYRRTRGLTAPDQS